jgi:hypothetical protein
VKLKAVAALGNWLLRMERWSTAAQQRLAEGLKEKEAVKRAHLRILNKVGDPQKAYLALFIRHHHLLSHSSRAHDVLKREKIEKRRENKRGREREI